MKYSWCIHSHAQGPSGRVRGRKKRKVDSPRTGVKGEEPAAERRQEGSAGKNGMGRALVWNLRWSKESLSASDPKGIEEQNMEKGI